MDQDGFSLALAFASAAILVSGLRRRSFDIQFLHAERRARPLAYWACALVLALIAVEGARRAWFVGCSEC